MPSMLEGMLLTLVEAMVCGGPALCSGVGGARELVQDGLYGCLAGSPFAEQLGEALERVWIRRMDLETMGRLGHEGALRFLPTDPGAALLKDIMDVV
jgi:glycosyltransferase involved in cell wall biosynthesis